MSTKQRSSQTFCARPGCGLAKSGHGFLAGACSNFIAPGTKEANEAKRAHLEVVHTPIPEPIEDDPTAKVANVTTAALQSYWSATGERL
jgi:hypothetical protein